MFPVLDPIYFKLSLDLLYLIQGKYHLNSCQVQLQTAMKNSSSVLFGTFWKFFSEYSQSVIGWILGMWNPWIQRASCILLLSPNPTKIIIFYENHFLLWLGKHNLQLSQEVLSYCFLSCRIVVFSAVKNWSFFFFFSLT